MGWRAFVEVMTGHLAWPVVVLVAVLMFRGEIRSKILLLSSAKVGPSGFEGAWDEAKAAVVPGAAGPVVSAVAGDRRPTPLGGTIADEPGPSGDSLTGEQPERAVSAAHDRLVAALRESLLHHGVTPPSAADPPALAHEARARGLIGDETARSVEGLEQMYRLARHNTDQLASAKAQEFLLLVNAVCYVLGNS